MRARVLVAALFLIAACGHKPAPTPPPPKAPVTQAPPVAPVAPKPPSAAPVAESKPRPPPPEPETFDLPEAEKPIDLTTQGVMDRQPSSRAIYNLLVVGWDRLDRKLSIARRSNAEAAKLATELALALTNDQSSFPSLRDRDDLVLPDDFDLESENVEEEVKNFASRLQDGEVGIVTTKSGYNIISRLKADPLETADILARQPETGEVWVYHVLIGFNHSLPDKRAEMTKAEADKVIADTVKKMKVKNADVPKLMKDVSQDADANSGTRGPVEVIDEHFHPFSDMGVRLKLGEVGVLRTRQGFYLLKRVPAPPEDPLVTASVLTRKQAADRVMILQMHFAWEDAHYSSDEAGKTRTRKELESLVKTALKKVNTKDADFLEIMKEMGETYLTPIEITPDNGFLAPMVKMALRLKVGEIGVCKTMWGIHILKRTE